MICCKIVADFSGANNDGKFSALLKTLSQRGDFLFDSGNLFFGNSDDETCTRSVVERIMRRAGYKEFFIQVYDKDHDPREADFINGWVTDKIVAANAILYERRSQEVFRNTARGLQAINAELDALFEQARAAMAEEVKPQNNN